MSCKNEELVKSTTASLKTYGVEPVVNAAKATYLIIKEQKS